MIAKEEENFFCTIDAGLERIERLFATLQAQGRDIVSGDDAFDMYQTHGFPPELFETLASEQNLGFDWEGFHHEMEKHGQISGSDKKMELFKSGPLDALKKTLTDEVPRLRGTTAEGKIVGIIAQGQLCEQVDEVGHARRSRSCSTRLPSMPRAAARLATSASWSGRTAGSKSPSTQKEDGFVLHEGHLRSGALAVGDKLNARVDAVRRQAIRRAHSATHILHYALQKPLGRHAQQQGSKVDRDWLRFDFTNPEALGHEKVAQVEPEVNARIAAGRTDRWTDAAYRRGPQGRGAMMLFGEKYPDLVRMVSMGDFSKELCGGTHLENTGKVGLFKIIGEESVSAGTRRITP